MRRPQFYGRRKLRPLRLAEQALWETLLPTFLYKPEIHRPHVLEIGFGKGEHLVEQAVKSPDKIFLGCEPLINGVAHVLKQIHALNLKNILLFHDDVHLVLESLKNLEKIYILFPDPWHKKRHHKRRIISPETIEKFQKSLSPGGVIHVATDHSEYKKWIQESFKKFPFYESVTLTPSWGQTRYQKKALAGEPSYFSYTLQKSFCERVV